MNKYFWFMLGWLLGLILFLIIIAIVMSNTINNNVCFDKNTATDLILYWLNDGNYTMRYLK